MLRGGGKGKWERGSGEREEFKLNALRTRRYCLFHPFGPFRPFIYKGWFYNRPKPLIS